MSSVIKVSSNRISADGKKISEHLETIPKLISEMESSLKKLESCWEGPACTTFHNEVVFEIEQLAEIYKSMENFAAGYEKSSRDYRRADQDVITKLKLTNVF